MVFNSWCRQNRLILDLSNLSSKQGEFIAYEQIQVCVCVEGGGGGR